MERVGEHPVPVGPLAVRWVAYELGEQRAGVATRARLRLENAGSAPWRSRGREGVHLAYHWLDPLGNAIVWDGNRTALPATVPPGEAVELEATVVAPRPPGSYRLAFDLVEELRYWFEELGSSTLDLPVEVRPRIDARRLAVQVHGAPDPDVAAALAAQAEPIVADDAVAVAHLVPGAIPAPDWSRLLLDAHAEGYGAVGGAIEAESRCRSPPLRGLGSGRRSQPALRRAASPPVTPRGSRAGDVRRPPRLRGQRCALRRSRRGQTSVAIRSSERLKIHAPAPSATSAAITV